MRTCLDARKICGNRVHVASQLQSPTWQPALPYRLVWMYIETGNMARLMGLCLAASHVGTALRHLTRFMPRYSSYSNGDSSPTPATTTACLARPADSMRRPFAGRLHSTIPRDAHTFNELSRRCNQSLLPLASRKKEVARYTSSQMVLEDRLKPSLA